MKFITRDMLGKARASFIKDSSYSHLQEAVAANERAARSYETTLFLSHKHSDRELVEYVIALLNSYDVDVYVDWLDGDMPTKTSGATALKLRKKIKDNRKFVLLATSEAVASTWCNWELGIGDAEKYLEHIALLPIADISGKWEHAEYLQIYPVITGDYSYVEGPLYVEFAGKREPIKDWLRR